MADNSAKVALVTGGSRGLGRAISLRLARDGFTIVVNYLQNHDAAKELCQMIVEQGGPPPLALQADVSKLSEVKPLFAEIKNKYGRLSVLVNNAGILGDRLFLLTTDDDWWRIVHTNLGAVVNCCRLAVPLMIGQRSGVIISITSTSGQRGVRGQTAYAASKAAIMGFSKSLAREVGHYNITINCVSPGLIDTGMVKSLEQDVISKHIANIPVQRLGKPEEVAEVVAMLADGRAGYLFGQVIAVDGGLTM